MDCAGFPQRTDRKSGRLGCRGAARARIHPSAPVGATPAGSRRGVESPRRARPGQCRHEDPDARPGGSHLPVPGALRVPLSHGSRAAGWGACVRPARGLGRLRRAGDPRRAAVGGRACRRPGGRSRHGARRLARGAQGSADGVPWGAGEQDPLRRNARGVYASGAEPHPPAEGRARAEQDACRRAGDERRLRRCGAAAGAWPDRAGSPDRTRSGVLPAWRGLPRLRHDHWRRPELGSAPFPAERAPVRRRRARAHRRRRRGARLRERHHAHLSRGWPLHARASRAVRDHPRGQSSRPGAAYPAPSGRTSIAPPRS
jgi:hypothetical protein